MIIQIFFVCRFGKGKPALRLKDIPAPTRSRDFMERVVAHCIVEAFIKEDFNYTAYSTISYLKINPSGELKLNSGYKICISVPVKAKRPSSSPISEPSGKKIKKTKA
jgi:ATP-dependent DNA helicase Q1